MDELENPQDLDTGEEDVVAVEKAPMVEPTEAQEPVKKSFDDILSDAYDKSVEDSADKKLHTEKPTLKTEPSPLPSAVVEPPPFWNKKDKEWFKTLPPKTQTAIADREKKRDEAFNTFRTEKQRFEEKYSGIDEALSPIEDQIQMSGLSRTQAVQKMAAWQAHLAKDPVNGLRELIASYNLSPQDLIESEGEEDPIDTRIQRVVQPIVSKLDGFLQSQSEAQSAYRQQYINSRLEEFAMEKDSSGNRAYPHFEKLVNEGYIAPIISSLAQRDPHASEYELLKKAYDIAWASHPEIREQVFAEREENRIAKLKQEAQRSRSAATPPNGTPKGSAVSHPKKSLDELLSSKYDELMSKGI